MSLDNGLFRQITLDRILIEGIGLTFFYGDGILRALAETGAKPIAEDLAD